MTTKKEDLSPTRVVRVQLGDKVVEMTRRDLVRKTMGVQLSRMVERILPHHRTDRNEPVDFSRNPQWQSIMLDPSPDIRIASHAQSGKSLTGLIRAIAGLCLGLEYAICMPTDQRRNDMVHNKLERTIANTPLYRQMMKAAKGQNSTHAKDFLAENGAVTTLHCVNGQSKTEMIAFTCDCVATDERDFSDRSNIAMLPKRMERSAYAFTYECSTPTFPGEVRVQGRAVPDNIMSEVMNGDHHEWFTVCEHCSHPQIQRWEEHYVKLEVDESGRVFNFQVRDQDWSPGNNTREARPVCLKCHRPFNRLGRSLWIPRNPGAAIRSYHVNRFGTDLGESTSGLIATFGDALHDPSKMQTFCNMTLGTDFVGGHLSFTRQLFASCCEPDPYPMLSRSDLPTLAGLDVNVPYFDLVIAQWDFGRRERPQTVVYAGKLTGLDAVYEVLRAFKVFGVVIDAQPEHNTATTFQNEAPAKCGAMVTRCAYSTHPLNSVMLISEKGETSSDPPRLIKVDKTASIDSLFQWMIRKRLRMFQNFAEIMDGRFLGEVTRPVRVLELDGGNERYVWQGKPDHQLQALNLAKIAGDPAVFGSMMPRAFEDRVLVAVRDLTIRPGARSRLQDPESVIKDRVLALRGRRRS